MKYRAGLVWGGLSLLTILFLLAVALNVHPALRGPDEWRWTYAIPGYPAQHLLPLLVVSGYGAAVYGWGRWLVGQARPSRRAHVGFLCFCAAAVPVLQVALLTGESPDVVEQLYFRTVSAGSSGFFSVGSLIDNGRDFLSHYPTLMPTFPVHPQRYPPGIPLLFYASREPLAVAGIGEMVGGYLRPYQCLDLTLMRIPNVRLGTAVLQMLLPLFSGLLIFPLHGLARRTLGWETAVWSVALYPLVPSFALWAGRWDQFFPLLTVTAWYLFVVGLAENRRGVLFASGLVLAMASLLSFGLVVMLAPMGLWALLWLAAHKDAWNGQWVLINGFFFLAGLALLWVVVQLVSGTGFWEIWQVSMGYHLGLARSYWTWLGYHLYDFGIFLGVPLALLCLFAFFYALLTVRQTVTALPLAFGLGIILLNISGTARGEVARVWIFLTPFALMCAVWAATRLSRRTAVMAVLLVLMGGQLLVFNAFLRVVNTGLTAVPERVVVYERPLMPYALDDVQLEEVVSLLGYAVREDESRLEVTLYWQPRSRLATAYTVFNHVVDDVGQLVAQQDGMPLEGGLPTTCWQPGEIITDSYTIPLEPSLAPGEYTLLAGMYDPLTGERLLVTGLDDALHDAVILDKITR